MKYKMCALALVIVAVMATLTFFTQADPNLDTARSIVCMQASREGRPEVIYALISKIDTKNALAASKAYLAAYEKNNGLPISVPEEEYDTDLFDFEIIRHSILNSSILGEELVGCVKNMPFSVKKPVVYALLADKFSQNGDCEAYQRFMDSAYLLMQAFSPVISENETFEVMDILGKHKDGVRLAKFAERLFFSSDLFLHIYSYGKYPKMLEFYSTQYGDEAFKKNNWELSLLMWRIAVLGRMKEKMSHEEFERIMVYSAIRFNMTWTIKNWEAYKYPLLAYVSRIFGLEEFYEHYKRLSLSDGQIEDMSAGLFPYVEYSANAFAMAGDPEAAVDLLRRLPAGREKNITVKRSIRNILAAPCGLDIVIRENLL